MRTAQPAMLCSCVCSGSIAENVVLGSGHLFVLENCAVNNSLQLCSVVHCREW